MSAVKEIIGYTPHSGQAFLHQKMQEGKHFYFTFNIGRQWGKTMMMINQMLEFVVNNKNYDIAFISPTLKQSRRVFNEILRYTNNVPIFEANKSDLIFYCNTSKSRIDFHSSEQGDNIRGFHYHIVVRDESAFMPDGFYHEIVAPMLINKGVLDVSISTPKGRNSDHFRRFVQGIDNDLYFSHTETSLDNPFANKAILADIKKQTPDHIWRQEYLAEFLDGGTLFKNIGSCTYQSLNIASTSGQLYGGLDIGRADDYTVLTIINSKNKVVFVERWRHLEWKVIAKNVANKIRNFDAQTFVEINNQGDVFYELLEEELKGKKNLLYRFHTNSESKKNIIENLIVDFENKDIQIPDVDWLKMELESFTYTYTPSTGKVRYSAPPGLHDDGVISLALARESSRKTKSRGKYILGY